MADSTFMLLPDMGEYAAYIWASYGLAAIVMIALLLSATSTLRQAQHTLNRLQSGTQPINEQGAEDK